jgi:hypothetical protein
MERIMGRADNPVRAVLNYAAEHFLADLPVSYLLTVMEPIAGHEQPVMRGLFAGTGQDCFYRAADLTIATNLTFLDEAPDHVVAYLDPDEFHSTWLGNKAIYRSRMAIADGGTLTIIAPGVQGFGEDNQIDRLIRRHGYYGRDATLAAVDSDPEVAQDLSAAAHLIHGSSEGRFRIEYAAGGLSPDEINGNRLAHHAGRGADLRHQTTGAWPLDRAIQIHVTAPLRPGRTGKCRQILDW